MAIRGLRKIEADVIRHKGNAVMEAGIVVKMALGVASDADSLLIPCDAATSGDSKTLGILLDKVITRPAEAEDSSDAQLKGIISDWIFTDAQPLFQEEGLRFVGEEVGIMRKGLIMTNCIENTSNPSGGMFAYAGDAGDLTARDGPVVGPDTPIGVWQSPKDSDGYAQLYVDISE